MESVTGRLGEAFAAVASNRGAPGPDGRSIDEVREHLDKLLPKLTEALLKGEYEPGDIRRVWIPKAGGEVYVRSERAGQRVMASITDLIERRLRLKVNAEKSAVARPEESHFLGFSL